VADRKIDPESQAIGRRLRGLRTELGVSVEHMAETLAMSEENYRHYERGRNRLGAVDLPRFALALGVTAQELTDRLQITAGGEGNAAPSSTPPPPTLESRIATIMQRYPDLRAAFAHVGDRIDADVLDFLVRAVETGAEVQRNRKRQENGP